MRVKKGVKTVVFGWFIVQNVTLVVTLNEKTLD
jgi:hypothetical protein